MTVKVKKSLDTTFTILFLLGTVFFCGWAFFHFRFWTLNPFTNEFREGVSLDIVERLREGINPFSDQTDRAFYYMYGLGFPWLVTWVSELCASNSYLVHRCVSLACTLLSAGLISIVVYRTTRKTIYGVWAFLLMTATAWVLNEANARPDQLGLLCVLTLSVLLPSWGKRISGCLGLALITVVAFYIKQYFLFIGAVAFLCLLFINKRNAWWYVVFCVTLLAITAVAVNRYYPYYFLMTVFSFGGLLGWSGMHFLKQSAVFTLFYWPFLLFVLVFTHHVFRRFSLRFDFRNWQAPLFSIRPLSPVGSLPPPWIGIFAAQSLVAALVLVYLGGSLGAFLSYFYQLLLPPLIVVGFYAVQECCSAPPLGNIVRLSILVCSLWHYGIYSYGCHFTPPLTQSEQETWGRAMAILERYKTGAVCLDAPVFVDFAIRHQIPLYDNGHSTGPLSLKAERIPMFLPEMRSKALEIKERYRSVRMERDDLIRSGHFDLIVTCYPFPEGFDLRSYRLSDTLRLRSGRQQTDYTFWVKR